MCVRVCCVRVAMTGESFCDAGRRVLDLVTRNGLSLWVLDRLCWLTMFVGRLLGMFAGILTTGMSAPR